MIHNMKTTEKIKAKTRALAGRAKDWDLEERDRWLNENHDGEEAPVNVIVGEDE